MPPFCARCARTRRACRPASWPWTRARARCAPGGQPRLRAGPVRPRAGRAPPAGLHLQALCVRRRVRPRPAAHRYADGLRGGDPAGPQAGVAPTDGNKPPSDMPMTLSDGLAYSKNTITAQLMQQVGPVRVAQLARAMGVRESTLDVVPSLALGTSPVTLKEMVALRHHCQRGQLPRAPGYHAHRGQNGKVLEEFAPPAPERALGLTAAQQLRNALRGVVDKGTGVAIRSRWGIQRRRGGQDRHHAGQHRWLVHPDAPAAGGGRVVASTTGASPCAATTGARARTARCPWWARCSSGRCAPR